MQDCLQDGFSCFQYADDTTVLHYATPKEIIVCVDKMKKTLNSIKSSGADSNMLLNKIETKEMVITTTHMSKMHNFDGYTPPVTLKNKAVDRVDKFKLLGTLVRTLNGQRLLETEAGARNEEISLKS